MTFPGEPRRMTDSIKRLKPHLSVIMKADYRLVGELHRLRVLTARQHGDILRERMGRSRNDALLDFLTSEEQCDKFMTALQRTQQQHVANYIQENGGQNSVAYIVKITINNQVCYLYSE